MNMQIMIEEREKKGKGRQLKSSPQNGKPKTPHAVSSSSSPASSNEIASQTRRCATTANARNATAATTPKVDSTTRNTGHQQQQQRQSLPHSSLQSPGQTETPRAGITPRDGACPDINDHSPGRAPTEVSYTGDDVTPPTAPSPPKPAVFFPQGETPTGPSRQGEGVGGAAVVGVAGVFSDSESDGNCSVNSGGGPAP